MALRIDWKSCAAAAGALMVSLTISMGAVAQNGPPPSGGPGAGGPPPGAGRAGGPPNPAEQAIEYRQAVYTVIGRNFGPIGGVLQGRVEYNAADVAKRADRVAYMAAFIPELFPDISKEGNTKAKPEIWTDRAGFDLRVKAFVDASGALAALVKKDSTNSAAFKEAAGKVAESCKGCHDNYRAK